MIILFLIFKVVRIIILFYLWFLSSFNDSLLDFFTFGFIGNFKVKGFLLDDSNGFLLDGYKGFFLDG
jgi:hypothetical protein